MRHGAAFQGNPQGESGRDPEVHHQGADHALIRALSRASFPILLLAFAASACGTSPAPSGAPGSGAPAAKPSAAPPSAGTILYHEPKGSGGMVKRSEQSKTLLFTTAAEPGIADDGSYQTFSGTLAKDVSSRTVAEKLFKSASTRIARVLSPKKFGELWSNLQAAGLFELTPYRGKDPPASEDYFLLQSGKQRWIFTRPIPRSPPSPDDPAVPRFKTWVNAKIIVFDVLNER